MSRQIHREPDGSPGTWRPHFEAGVRITATVFCPECGTPGTLHRHEIEPLTGTVVPSVVCPRPDCRFHDHVELVGWNPMRKVKE